MIKSAKWKIAWELAALIVYGLVTYDFAARWNADKEKKILLLGAICFTLLAIMRAADLWLLITKKNKQAIDH